MSSRRARRGSDPVPDGPIAAPREHPAIVRACPQCGRPIGPMQAGDLACPRRASR